jgi:hypothetical protein
VSRAVLFDLFNTLVPGTLGPPVALGPALGVDAPMPAHFRSCST